MLQWKEIAEKHQEFILGHDELGCLGEAPGETSRRLLNMLLKHRDRRMVQGIQIWQPSGSDCQSKPCGSKRSQEGICKIRQCEGRRQTLRDTRWRVKESKDPMTETDRMFSDEETVRECGAMEA